MKYLSLFSGIGGFELGIQQAYETTKNKSKNSTNNKGGTSQHFRCPLCVGYSEIDKYAIQIYEKHFPNHKNYGDITKIIASELPDFDLAVGGFPCQSFSIAGKRGGFKDTRGTLFFDIARILKIKRPRLLFLENVKGLLSHDEGNTFATIISTLDELGYDLQWQVLNSKDFGVPQNRERVFIVGHLRGTPRPKVFPIGDTDEIFNQENRKISIGVIGDRQGRYNSRQLIYEGVIMSEKNKKWIKDGKELSREFPQGQRVYSSGGLATTLAGEAGGLGAKTGLYAIPVLTPDRPIKRQNGRRFKEDGEPSFSLTAQDKHGIYDGMKIRRLTPTECERLQGFPDGWTKYGVKRFPDDYRNYKNGEMSDTQRYKTLGNAVTVNVIKEIAKKLF